MTEALFLNSAMCRSSGDVEEDGDRRDVPVSCFNWSSRVWRILASVSQADELRCCMRHSRR